MYGYTVEKSQLKRYNCNTLYTIGGMEMDRITQSMLDAYLLSREYTLAMTHLYFALRKCKNLLS